METIQTSFRAVLEDSDATHHSRAKTCQDLMNDELTWEEMIQKLLEIFESDKVSVEEVEAVLEAYTSKMSDWKKFAKFDKYKYTRNLIHEGNGRFNLMMLCWAEGNQSTIHDHSNAHCFVKCLEGEMKETKYFWPNEAATEDGGLKQKEVSIAKANDVTYMSDQLGLHRIENPSHSNKAISLHLYSPPFNSCRVFDERTSSSLKAPMTFWSKYGEKVGGRKSESKSQATTSSRVSTKAQTTQESMSTAAE